MIEIMNKLWVPLLFLTSVGNIAYSVITRMNHLSHIDERLSRLEKKFDEKVDIIFKETAKQGERISRIEGKMNGHFR